MASYTLGTYDIISFLDRLFWIQKRNDETGTITLVPVVNGSREGYARDGPPRWFELSKVEKESFFIEIFKSLAN
jgi:hypothetical protein